MMGRQRICLALLAIVAAATAKPPPMGKGPPPWAAGPAPWAAGPAAWAGGAAPWAGFAAGKSASPWAAYGAYGAGPASPYAFGAGKSVYSRSLGPAVAPAMNTITVPYVPKASPFFPKFVDPQAMIAKKTEMLANLFGGLGPVTYPAAGKPLLYTAGNEPSKDTSELQEILGEDKTPKDQKRGIFGPKFGPPSPFSPFAPKFGPMPPNSGPFGAFPGFAPYPGFSPMETSGDTLSSSRRKRAIVGLGPETQNLGPPPPYPGLSSIPEEPETDASGTPKQYLPGMFGPFSPFFAPVVDPSIFIAKKTAFLNSLFSSLATSTPAPFGTIPDPLAPKSTIVPADFWLPFPAPTEASSGVADVTDLPIPKSTIVPADFWIPSSIIPGPTEYTDKVSVFLNKLFDSLKLNKTLVSSMSDEDTPKTIVARSVDDVQTIITAKDAIVDSIMGELGSIKSDMLQTLNDMIIAEKTAAAFAKPTKASKPGKPLSPWAAMFAPPTIDPTLPFRQKMLTLSQVFDMLTGMQKNITKAIEETVKAVSATETPVGPSDADMKAMMPLNATLLDAIKAKLDSLDKAPVAAPAAAAHPFPGFWGAYPGAYPGVYSPSTAAKRNVNDEDYYEEDRENREKAKRGVKMTMHQGYQSMPPGAFETIQAGGGSVPGHQGGGIKLFIQMPPAGSPGYENDSQQNDYEDWGKQWAEWAEKLKSQDDGSRHHHNHH